METNAFQAGVDLPCGDVGCFGQSDPEAASKNTIESVAVKVPLSIEMQGAGWRARYRRAGSGSRPLRRRQVYAGSIPASNSRSAAVPVGRGIPKLFDDIRQRQMAEEYAGACGRLAAFNRQSTGLQGLPACANGARTIPRSIV